jgi:hypothetical protein
MEIETGRSGISGFRSQVVQKDPWGVSIPLPSRASGPYRRLCLKGEPEILKRFGKEFHVTKTILIEMHVEIPRGEKNTPGRRSNNAVGDGNFVVNSQEMSGLSEFRKREFKILEMFLSCFAIWPDNSFGKISLLSFIWSDDFSERFLSGRMVSSEEFLRIPLSGRMISLQSFIWSDDFFRRLLSGRMISSEKFLHIPLSGQMISLQSFVWSDDFFKRLLSGRMISSEEFLRIPLSGRMISLRSFIWSDDFFRRLLSDRMISSEEFLRIP